MGLTDDLLNGDFMFFQIGGEEEEAKSICYKAISTSLVCKTLKTSEILPKGHHRHLGSLNELGHASGNC